MHTMERETKYSLPIKPLDYHVGNCFLAAVMMYIKSVFGKSEDLLQFVWYFAYLYKDPYVQYIDFEEIREYVVDRYNISFEFIHNLETINYQERIHSELNQNKPVGVTVDYRCCPWTKKTFLEEYAYHFILIIGYTESGYLCLDNETKSTQIVSKEDLYKTITEMLIFKGTPCINENIDYKYAFLSESYKEKRKNMSGDLKKIVDSIINNDLGKSYDIWSIKLTLISQNYSNFNIFLNDFINDKSICILVDSISESLKLLSVYCLKLFHRRSDVLIERFISLTNKIILEDEQLRRELMGVIEKNEINLDV